jgi:TP901 family phage tail tape measure protein
MAEKEVSTIELKGVMTGIESMTGALKEIQKELKSVATAMTKVSGDFSKFSQTMGKVVKAGKENIDSLKKQEKAHEKAAKKAQEHAKIELTAAQKVNAAWAQFSQEKAPPRKKENERILEKNTLRGFQRGMKEIMPSADSKTLSGAISNWKSFNKVVDSVALSGIATKQSLDGLNTGVGMGDFKRGITNAEKFRLKMDNLGTVTKAYGQHMRGLGTQMQWTGRQMMVGMALPIALLGMKTVTTFTSINTEFTRMRKVLDKDVTPKVFERLKQEAMDVGTIYGNTTKDTGKIFADLAAQGIPTDQLKGFTDEILRISALGDIDTSAANEFFRIVKSTFVQSPHWEGDKLVEGTEDLGQALAETKDIMNQFNAIENATALNLKDMAEAFPEVANAANLFGLSAAETAAVLAGMYSQGIDAVEAAHSLKFVLGRIVDPTDTAAKAFQELTGGFDLNTLARGRKGLEQLADIILKLGPKAQMKLLGDIGGLRQANRVIVALREIRQGAEQIPRALKAMAAGKTMSEATSGMNDYSKATIAAAQDTSILAAKAGEEVDIVIDSPEVQFKRLQNQFQNFLYNIGSLIMPAVISTLIKFIKMLDRIQKLPDPIKKFIAGFIAALAVLGPLVYVIGQLSIGFGVLTLFTGKLIPSLKAFAGGAELAAGKVALVGNEAKILGSRNPFKRFFAIWQGETNSTTLAIGRLETILKTQTATMTEAAAGTSVLGAAQNKATADAIALAAANQAVTDSVVFDPRMGSNRSKATGQLVGPVPAPSVPRSRDATTGRFIKSEAKQIEAATAQGIKSGASKAARGGGIKSLFSNILSLATFSGLSAGMGKAFSKFKGLFSKGPLAAAETKAFSISSIFTKMGASLKGLFGGGAASGAGGGGALAGFFGSNPVGWILAIIAVILILIPVFAKLTGHWDDFYRGMKNGIDRIKEAFSTFGARIKPALDALGDAFQKIKDAFGTIGRAISAAFAPLFEGSNDPKRPADNAKTAWEETGRVYGDIATGIANVITWTANVVGAAIEVIALAIEIIAVAIRATAPLFGFWARVFANTFGFIVSLLTGHWANAWAYFVRIMAAYLAPVIAIAEFIVDAIFMIPRAVAAMFRGMGGLPIVGKWFRQLGDSIPTEAIKKFQQFSLNSWLDKNLPKPGAIFDFGGFGDFEIPHIKPEPPGQPKEDGRGVGQDFGEGVGEGAADELAKQGTSIFDNFLSALKSRLDKNINAMKDSVVNALKKSHEAHLKVFDEQIKSIEKVEKAEEKLRKTQEYIQKRKEMIDQQSLDAENYRRNRALAIYEGRTDDARMLDLEFRKTTKDGTKALVELDRDRARALLDDEREAEKERINIRKEAAAQRYQIEEDALKKSLDLLTEYTPRTLGEMQNMIDGVNELLRKYGLKTLKGGFATAFGAYKLAVKETKVDLDNEFFWSGEDARAAWLAGFAGVPLATLLKPLFDAAAAAGGGAGGDVGGADIGGGGAGAGGLEEIPETKMPKMPDFKLKLPDFTGIGKEIAAKLGLAIIGGIIGFMVGGPVGAAIGAFIGLILIDLGKASWKLMQAGWQLIQDLWDGILSAAPKIWNWFKELPGKIVDFISENAPKIWNWFKELPGKIVGFLTSLPGKLAYWIGFALGTVARIVLGSGKVLYRGAVKLGKALWRGIKEIGPKIWHWMKEVGPKIFNAIKKGGEKLIAAGKWIIKTLFNAVKEAPKNLANIGKWVVGALWGAIKAAFSTAVNIGKWIFNAIKKAVSDPIGTAKAIGGAGKDIVIALVNAIKKNAPKIWNWFKKLPKKVVKTIGSALQNAWDAIVNVAGNFINGFLDGLTGKTGTDLKPWLKELPGKIIRWLGDVALWLVDTGWKLIKGLFNGIKNFVTEKLLPWMGKLNQKLGKAIRKGAKALVGVGGWILKQIRKGVTEWLPNILKWFVSLPGKMARSIRQSIQKLKTVGGWILRKIRDGIKDWARNLWEWFTGLPGIIRNAIGWAKQKFIDVGKAIGNWIKDGIKETAWDIIGGGDRGINPLKWQNWVPGIPYTSKGGPVSANELRVVGEEGPEFFIPNINGRVLSNPDSKALMSKMTQVQKYNAPKAIGNMKFYGPEERMAAHQGAGQSGGDNVNIYVDTFIGQREWFDKMLKDYNIMVSPHKQRARGSINRSISSYTDNNVRYRE